MVVRITRGFGRRTYSSSAFGTTAYLLQNGIGEIRKNLSSGTAVHLPSVMVSVLLSLCLASPVCADYMHNTQALLSKTSDEEKALDSASRTDRERERKRDF